MRNVDTPTTAAKRKRRQPFVLADATIRAGTAKTIELSVARLPSGTSMTMPAIVIHGARPGPSIWLSGALHGDELNGVAIVRRLVRTLDAKNLAGTVIAVPIVNVFGVTTGSRYLPDRRDLNRSFPGSPRGSLAGRLAHLFFDKIATRCDVGLDFHTGSAGRCNLPQLRCDLDDEETLRHATAFATPVILDAKLRDGSLRAAARSRGIRVLLYEAGEAMRFDRPAIDVGVAGSLRVMDALGMIDGQGMIDPAPGGVVTPVLARSSTWARAGRSGFCLDEVELGQRVEPGQRVATIIDSVGKAEHSVSTKRGGLVIGLLRTALVHRGDAVVHVAQTPFGPADPATSEDGNAERGLASQ